MMLKETAHSERWGKILLVSLSVLSIYYKAWLVSTEFEKFHANPYGEARDRDFAGQPLCRELI